MSRDKAAVAQGIKLSPEVIQDAFRLSKSDGFIMKCRFARHAALAKRIHKKTLRNNIIPKRFFTIIPNVERIAVSAAI